MSNATVRIVRGDPGGYDQYGDPVEGTTTYIDLPGAVVAPRLAEAAGSSTGIDGRGRQGIIVGLQLLVRHPPDDVELRHTDQVEVDGVLYDVEGEPGRWRSPFVPGPRRIEAALRRAEG